MEDVTSVSELIVVAKLETVCPVSELEFECDGSSSSVMLPVYGVIVDWCCVPAHGTRGLEPGFESRRRFLDQNDGEIFLLSMNAIDENLDFTSVAEETVLGPS